MLGTVKYSLFAIGTLAFFVAVYLAIAYPELTSGQAEQVPQRPRLFDRIATWVMWAGWCGAGLLTLLDRSGFLDTPD